MKLTKCPYCGKQVTYMQAFLMRNRGEFFCNKCKKESNILIKKTLLVPFFVALILSLMILAVFMFFTSKDNLFFMLLVALPFFWFYFMTPFYIELSPRKKHMDALYDTHIVESPVVEPDPTVAKKSTVIPAFVDDVFSDKDDPVINTDVFNAIKEERKILEESTTTGDTKSFDKFENVSSSRNIESTMPVSNLKDVKVKTEEKTEKARYDLHNFE